MHKQHLFALKRGLTQVTKAHVGATGLHGPAIHTADVLASFILKIYIYWHYLCFIPNKLEQALPQQQQFAIKTPAMLSFSFKRKFYCVLLAPGILL